MIIMFVRHGDSVNDKLTELGKSQCELAVKGKEGYRFSKIYSSVAGRCKETAEYFKERFSLEIEYLKGVKDRELLSGSPKNDDEQEWYVNYLNKNFSHKKPEGCKEFLQRNFLEFDEILKRHKDKNENVILVAHSCTFYAIQEYFNPSDNENIKYYRLGNCSKVYFEIN